MVKPANLGSIEKATGIVWNEWVETLDELNGRELGHAEIARLAHDQLDGKIDSPGWWSQGVAVAYEQHIGRRAPGQRADGTYEVSVTKTMVMSRDDAFTRVRQTLDRLEEIGGTKLSDVRTSTTPVRHYWKASVSDGSKIIIGVEQRDDKSLVAVQVQRLADVDHQIASKEYWRAFLMQVFKEV